MLYLALPLAMAHTALALISIFPITLLALAIYNLFFHPLAHIPGPLLARASGIPSWYHSARGKRHIWLWQQFQIHGPKIRAAPNLVLFLDPDAYADIYGPKSNVQRSNFYTAWRRNDNDVNVLNVADRKDHAARRKLLNLCFTESAVKEAATLIVNHVDRWNELILEKADKSLDWSDPVSLSRNLDELVFDIMGDISFGKSLDIKEPGENPWKTIPNAMSDYMRFYYHICRSPFLELLLWLKPRGLDALFEALTPQSIRNYNTFVNRSISERFQSYKLEKNLPESERRRDLFYFLLEAWHASNKTTIPGHGPVLDDHSLRGETNLLIIAGSDTTSTSLTSIFFHLSQDSWRSQRLVNELHDTFSSVEDIVYGPKLKSCMYLCACIDEGMRMNPAGLCEFPRVVLPGGIHVKGEFFPESTVLGTVPYCDGRNEQVYGDPTVFRPERWIVDEERAPGLGGLVTQESVARMRANFHPFLSGPGSCVGRQVALAEMMLVVARTLYRLELRRAAASTLGCGCPELGWGDRDTRQLEMRDAFVAIREGPEIQFRRRA